jgi:hypothetical protein
VTDPHLEQAAHRLLRANDLGAFTKPAAHQYPHLWNWDSALIAIGLAHQDPARARLEIDTLLGAQWANGMVPHIVYPNGPSDYFPTPDFWRTEGLAHAGPVSASGFTQPPVAATAVRALLEGHADTETRTFAERNYPRLLAWHRWLRSARDPHGSGLSAIIHPWESGTDNAPRWREALDALGAPTPPAYARRDQHHVHADERPVADDYERFMHLIGVYRDLGWEDERLAREAPFFIQDVLFNAILLRADADLAWLGDTLGLDASEPRAWREAGEGAFAGLWVEERGSFVDRNLRSGGRARADTWVGFAALYAGLANPTQAARMVRELTPTGRFGRLPFGVPTVAVDDPSFEPRRYWAGPVWIHANWFILRGLQRYGYHTEAARLRATTLALVRQGGFVEYYDPRDGSACGARDFSWSAALTIDLLRNPDGA